ncbi:hypothetical protein ACHAQC_002107 [Fusarium culmorum]
MTQKFSSEFTLVGPPQAPMAVAASMVFSTRDRRTGSFFKQDQRPCDTCFVSANETESVSCEPDPDHPEGCCRLCALHNRPCTFTAISKLESLYGDREPHVKIGRRIAKYPTGPYRFLTYHRSMNPEELNESRPVQVPFEERLGLWVEDQEIEDEIDDDQLVASDEED